MLAFGTAPDRALPGFASVMWNKGRFIATAALLAAALASSPAGADYVWWTPRLVICDRGICQEAPDPYWEGPYRVQRPCREWRQCYWHQRWR